jgi:hypothetical protein
MGWIERVRRSKFSCMGEAFWHRQQRILLGFQEGPGVLRTIRFHMSICGESSVLTKQVGYHLVLLTEFTLEGYI